MRARMVSRLAAFSGGKQAASMAAMRSRSSGSAVRMVSSPAASSPQNRSEEQTAAPTLAMSSMLAR